MIRNKNIGEKFSKPFLNILMTVVFSCSKLPSENPFDTEVDINISNFQISYPVLNEIELTLGNANTSNLGEIHLGKRISCGEWLEDYAVINSSATEFNDTNKVMSQVEYCLQVVLGDNLSDFRQTIILDFPPVPENVFAVTLLDTVVLNLQFPRQFTELQCFNIYRDSMLLDSVVFEIYHDLDVEYSVTYLYQVSAVYDCCESFLSDEVVDYCSNLAEHFDDLGQWLKTGDYRKWGVSSIRYIGNCAAYS